MVGTLQQCVKSIQMAACTPNQVVILFYRPHRSQDTILQNSCPFCGRESTDAQYTSFLHKGESTFVVKIMKKMDFWWVQKAKMGIFNKRFCSNSLKMQAKSLFAWKLLERCCKILPGKLPQKVPQSNILNIFKTTREGQEVYSLLEQSNGMGMYGNV